MKYAIRLQIKTGDASQERLVELQEGQVFILGRETEKTLSDGAVSRKHCGLTVENGELLIVDTGSRNGTYLNDIEITRNQLKVNDVIRIGNNELLVQSLVKTETPLAKTPAQPLAQQRLRVAEDTVTVNRLNPRGLAHKPIDPFEAEPVADREWFARLPGPIRSWLEQQDLDFRALPSLYKMAFSQPASFFETTHFEGGRKTSFTVIFLCGIIIGLFNLRLGVIGLIATPLLMVVGHVLICGFLHLLRTWLGVSAGYSEFLRFGAFVSLMAVPVSLPSALIPPLGPLLWLMLFGWAMFGFYVAFKPRVIPVIMLGVFSIFLFGTAWVGMIWQYLLHQRPAAEHATQSSLISESQSNQVVQVPPAPQHTEKKNPLSHRYRSLIGEFKSGEGYTFWVQLAGVGFKREGSFNIVVKSVAEEGATVAIDGQIDKKPQHFEQNIGWEMDLTSLTNGPQGEGASQLKTAGLEHVVNLILSYRIMLLLSDFTPDSDLPAALRSSKPLSVGGLTAQYFENWGPSRTIARVKGTVDIAASANYGIPLFVQARNPDTLERVYIRLKKYRIAP